MTTEPKRADVDEDVDDHDDQATDPLLIQLDGCKNSVGLMQCLLLWHFIALVSTDTIGLERFRCISAAQIQDSKFDCNKLSK